MEFEEIVISSAIIVIATLIAIYIYYRRGGIKIWREDHNKPEERKVLTGAGLPVMVILLLTYGVYSYFYSYEILLFIGLILTSIISIILGVIDELVDIRVWKKVPLMLVPPLPLVILSFSTPLWNSTQVFWIDFGILYWIIVVPITYMGFSNGANIIAGYDGLEGGVYILISFLYLLIGTLINNNLVILLTIPLLFSLLAFEIFNLPPSKVLLGNVGSFPIGGLLGIIPLIGHFEIVLPIVFLPHLIEFFFKIRYKGKTTVFGVVDKHGIIHNEDGIKSVIHWIISWGNMNEKKITLAMLSIESILCTLAFFVWYIWYVFV